MALSSHTKRCDWRWLVENQHPTRTHAWQVGSNLVRTNLFIPKCLNFSCWKHGTPDHLQDRSARSGRLNRYGSWWIGTFVQSGSFGILLMKLHISTQRLFCNPSKRNLATALPPGHSLLVSAGCLPPTRLSVPAPGTSLRPHLRATAAPLSSPPMKTY